MSTKKWATVDAFSRAMKAKLDENRHKGDEKGWRDDPPEALLRRLREEVGELHDAIVSQSADEVRKEAADVGNFAMMIFDIANRRRR